MTTDSFWEALKAGDQSTALTLVEDEPELLAERWPSGHSPIRFAFECGHAELAAVLAERTTIDALEACLLGRVDDLEASAVDVAERTPDGWTLLHMAAFAGQAACIDRLLAAGADVAAVSENPMANTPLHAAIAGAGQVDAVARLLAAGADAAAPGAQGITPLHLAASRGAAELVTMLQDAGATSQPMDDGQLPADLARARGFPELAATLDAES